MQTNGNVNSMGNLNLKHHISWYNYNIYRPACMLCLFVFKHISFKGVGGLK